LPSPFARTKVGIGSRVVNSACQPLQDACSTITGSTNIILDINCPDNINSLCVGGINRDPTNPSNPPNQSPCLFDEGGPLVLNKASPSAPLSGTVSNDRLVGLASWGARGALVFLVTTAARNITMPVVLLSGSSLCLKP
jgi:hypothetical protein